MGELKSVLLGAIVGGFISMSTTWMQSNMSKDNAFATEKRQKMVSLMEDVYLLESCKANMLRASLHAVNLEDECSIQKAQLIAFRITSTTYFYFPELSKQTSDYLNLISPLYRKASDCKDLYGTPNGKEKYTECINAIMKEPYGGMQLAKLAAEANNGFRGIK